ncbi:MAG: SpoIIE family protein phosphatase [Bacteroidales bacterium]|nr:SpoIIE family protein phosphatase [Bacteroidales bacterium]
MNSNNIHIDVNCQQINHEGERICGDVFLTKKIEQENRIVCVLSDGMGHGVKANMLATLTATMALNFTKEHKEPQKIAEIIMKTLPVCSVRQISYSTFTIIDIEIGGKVSILEYDNPQCAIIRDNQEFDPGWQCLLLEEGKNRKELLYCSFTPQKEDRIIFWSDGIAQSGLGSDQYPFGWGVKDATNFVIEKIKKNPIISARKLAVLTVNRAFLNDNYHAKDDTSSAGIYFREPRKLLLCTGPPIRKSIDKELAELVKNFPGKKVISGGTTADIIARELNIKIEDNLEFDDVDLPPESQMEGIDLVTEGILTLSKVANILKNYSSDQDLGNGPADKMVKLFIRSDEIHILIGTKINIAHQDPTLPVELEIRRTVAKRIARLLDQKFLKGGSVKFI